MEKDSPILIYDGECNLCDRSVRFILNHEKDSSLYFTHINSPKGKEIRNSFGIDEEYDSILLCEGDRLYGKSDAVLRIALYLKMPFSFLPFFFWIPLFIRDRLYDLIARKRYSWFGKDSCIVPDERLRERFI